MKKIVILSLLLTLATAVTGAMCRCCFAEASPVSSASVLSKAPHCMDCCFSFEAERETCQLRFRENFPAIAPSADASFIDKALFNLTPFQYEPAEQGSPPKWRDPVPDYFPKNPLYLTLEVLRF